MNYKLQPGIVFTKICGQYLLIPDRKASETCPMIRRLSIISAALIENIVKGYPMEKIYCVYEILSRKSREEAVEKMDGIAKTLVREGYLAEVPGDDDETD